MSTKSGRRGQTPTKPGESRDRRARRLNPVRVLIRHLRYRAKKLGVPFNLTEGDLHVPNFCPVLGIRLKFNQGAGYHPDSPSVDRIIPSRGYIRGNVLVVSMKCNRIKSDATATELSKVAAYYSRLTKRKPK